MTFFITWTTSCPRCIYSPSIGIHHQDDEDVRVLFLDHVKILLEVPEASSDFLLFLKAIVRIGPTIIHGPIAVIIHVEKLLD
jgi:hypothetical protein